VELICDDQTGCKDFLYGVGDSAENCEANRSYLGQKIRLEKTSWICYSVLLHPDYIVIQEGKEWLKLFPSP